MSSTALEMQATLSDASSSSIAPEDTRATDGMVQRPAGLLQLQPMKPPRASEDLLSSGDASPAMIQIDSTGRSSVVRGLDDHQYAVKSSLHQQQQPDRLVRCLTKSELMADYADNSTWIRLRWSLLALIVVGWLAMLGTAIAIIATAPKCAPVPSLDWWQTALVYRIDVRSFQDTDGDGYGDLKGIQQRLAYISSLQVTAIHINSIYVSSASRYDVIDHVNVNPLYGTLDDLRSLIDAVHKKGLKLIVDFIPQRTSVKHAWFNASRHSNVDNDVNNTLNDFYVWHPGKQNSGGTKLPPNNWRNADGGSAWHYDKTKKQFYYHSFSRDEPDLNLQSEAVLTRLDEILIFWLKFGIDGFFIKSTSYLHGDLKAIMATESRDTLDQRTFLVESYALVSRWRAVVDQYSHTDGKPKSQFYPRVLIAEVNGTANQTISYVSATPFDVRQSPQARAHLSTNLALTHVKQGCHSLCVLELVKEWMNVAQNTSGIWSNWQLGNSDTVRITSRMTDPSYVNLANMLLLTLPGTAFSYYGDEIGMHDVTATRSTPQLGPMQWSGRTMAGFTNATKPWMPLADDYRLRNVEVQLAHGTGVTNVEVFKQIASLRRHPSIQWGDFYPGADDNVFYFVRLATGFPGFLVALNVGPFPAVVDFVSGQTMSGLVPEEAAVVATTANFVNTESSAGAQWGRDKEYVVDTFVPMKSVYLKPSEGIVFRWEHDQSVPRKSIISAD